jgi:beta-phosphoglucomutase-like phosphatase (HAD superfamily)
VEDFLVEFGHIPRCIASSGTLEYITQVLDCVGLAHWFEHRFSGQDVARGKPFPDLFLKAAEAFAIEPIDCVVIEDSPAGVAAGRAAGMHTIGLCAGGHILDGHSERLREAGADGIASSFRHVAELLAVAR